MRVVMAILFMGLLTFVAVMLMIAQAVIQLLPLIVVALLAWAAVRIARGRRAMPAAPPAPPARPVAARPVATAPVGGWVMVPVWMGPKAAQPTVIDGEVIEQDARRV